MSAPLGFLSDFGGADEWVAAVKGAVLRLAPQASFLDIAHDIPPFDIAKGALVLAAALPELPAGVHLAVVDPGVGTSRLALALRCGRGDRLVGPDNGLLLPAAERLGGIREAVALEAGEGAHPTFHGRDVFAPAAARLWLGEELAALGRQVAPGSLAPAPFLRATCADGAIYARVIDVDRFGSLRLDAGWEALSEAGLEGDAAVLVDIGDDVRRCDLARTFDEAGSDLLLYRDSAGVLALGARRGRADALTGAGGGTAVFIYRS